MGENRTVTCPLDIAWWATGNNIILRGDMPRRVMRVGLETTEENPEERSDFKYPNLLDEIRKNRPRLVAAALTILRAYCRAGRPKQDIKPWGSFEAWSNLVRSAIVWAGRPDPGLARMSKEPGTNNDADHLRQLIEGWGEVSDGAGCTVNDVLALLKDDTKKGQYGILRGALAEVFNLKPGELPGAKSVAGKFRRLKGRVVGGRRLKADDNGHGTQLWKVETVGNTAVAEEAEEVGV